MLGYYAALEKVEHLAAAGDPVNEPHIKALHALAMGDGGKRVRPIKYRDGQNVIRDGRSGAIVYMPPEAMDVSLLMSELVAWINDSGARQIPCPIRAGIAHYQFATIHPYYDGNGRTARLLATLILHLGGYDLKGLYSLEEYYARNLTDYYQALTIGPSHNYYGGKGRANSDITKWVDYFCQGVAESFEKVRTQALQAANIGANDASASLRALDPRQRKALSLFRRTDAITSLDVKNLFGISQRMARNLLSAWTAGGLIIVLDPARKSRKYRLAAQFRSLLQLPSCGTRDPSRLTIYPPHAIG